MKKIILFIAFTFNYYSILFAQDLSQQWFFQPAKIYHVVEDSILWIGTQGAGMVKKNLVNGTETRFTTMNSKLPSNVINCMKKDNYGKLWIGTNNGLVCLHNNEMKIFFGSNSTLLCNNIHSIEIDKSGKAWVSLYCGGIFYYDGKTWIDFLEQHPGFPYEMSCKISNFKVINDSTIFVINNSILYSYSKKSWKEIARNIISSLFLQSDSTIYFTISINLYRILPEKLQYDKVRIPSVIEDIFSIIEITSDKFFYISKNQIWENDGYNNRIVGHLPWTEILPTRSLYFDRKTNSISSCHLEEDSNRIVFSKIGTDTDNPILIKFPVIKGGYYNSVVKMDQTNDLWIFSYNEWKSLIDKRGIPIIDSFWNVSGGQFVFDKQNALWCAILAKDDFQTKPVLANYKENSWKFDTCKLFNARPFPTSTYIKSLAPDQQNGIWVSYYKYDNEVTGVLLRYFQKSWKEYRIESTFSSPITLVSGNDNSLWAINDNNIFQWNGIEWKKIVRSSLFSTNSIISYAADNNQLYVYANSNVYHYSNESWSQVDLLYFDKGATLHGIDKKGTLWFSHHRNFKSCESLGALSIYEVTDSLFCYANGETKKISNFNSGLPIYYEFDIFLKSDGDFFAIGNYEIDLYKFNSSNQRSREFHKQKQIINPKINIIGKSLLLNLFAQEKIRITLYSLNGKILHQENWKIYEKGNHKIPLNSVKTTSTTLIRVESEKGSSVQLSTSF